MTCTTKQTKGKWLTIAQKWQVIEEHGSSQPSPSLADLARWSQAKFKLSQPPSRATIANILRSGTTCTVKSKLEAACTPKGRSLTLRCPELEEFECT
ncbi:hypothetical protein PR003_g22957 [Phytophthora rubi]|uniref:ARS-binding protein 1 N-terminal domain-containing protein n=1 Tax=Phytophthora rubi TaxID=129364 RepID=A0A6A4CZH4_9STRA|nr:hypothetical protein PR003_g22957 [Phytophthora rubi]